MHEQSLHELVEATLNRWKLQHSDLDKRLNEAHGYAVFPAVGRASAVLGVSAGDGEVFEEGKPIGFANLRQITLGVQVGGETFGELLLFESKEALDQFKTSPVKFNANASAVLVKAGGTGTTDFGGVEAMAFREGGELLELSLGVQKFNFMPPGAMDAEAAAEAAKGPGLASKVASKLGFDRKGKEEKEEEEQKQSQEGEPQQPRSV